MGGPVVAAVVAAMFGSLLWSHETTIAACPTPTVKFRPTRVARGATVTITGQNFGDACFDTGTVPEGVGKLGDPLAGLVIVIDQADREYVVASGSADQDYKFSVEIIVPAGLEPGEATVGILAGDARMNLDIPLVISAVQPVGDDDEAVATFGPTTTASPDPAVTGATPPIPAEIPDVRPTTTIAVLDTAPIDAQGTASQTWRAYGLVVGGVAVLLIIGFIAWSRSKRWQ
jgi:hypothetical protein